MSIKQIDRTGWPIFFATLTKILASRYAEVEVASLDLGTQIDDESTQLFGVVYDHKDDLIEVALDGLYHLILTPRVVYVNYGVGGLISLEIVDADDVGQIIKLKDPLALPAMSEHTSREPAR